MYIVQIATISIRGRMGGPRDASGRPLMYVGIPGNYWREQACVTVIGITIQPLFPLFAGVSNDTPSPSSAPFLPRDDCSSLQRTRADLHRFPPIPRILSSPAAEIIPYFYSPWNKFKVLIITS